MKDQPFGGRQNTPPVEKAGENGTRRVTRIERRIDSSSDLPKASSETPKLSEGQSIFVDETMAASGQASGETEADESQGRFEFPRDGTKRIRDPGKKKQV